MTLELHYGNAVSGDQRFERPALQDKLLRTLASSGGIKMFGLRRIGKSTLRRFVIETMHAENKPVAFMDAQGLHTVHDMLAELFRALPKASGLTQRILGFVAKDSPIRSALEALASGNKVTEGVVAAYWKEVANGIRNALREATEPPPLLIIDEFSLLLRNVLERNPESGRDDVNQLLAAMRQWRDAGMKMLLTGSIGITALSRKYNLNRDHLNDLLPFNVPELTHEEAREFIRQATATPSAGRWTNAHTLEFITQSGVLYPSFLAKGLLAVGVKFPPEPEAFASIFSDDVRPVLHEDFYNEFNRRFKLYGEISKHNQGQLIVPVLKRIMDAERGTQLEDLALAEGYTRIDLSEALEMLVEDGFIHFTEDLEGNRTWMPASRLVTLWWKRARLA